MRNVLVTHADLPLGRRIVKVLWHDAGVDRIVAVGEGAVPRAFQPYRIGAAPRLVYERIDLARQRSVSELFRSKRLRSLGVDSVVYVPRHGAGPEGPPVVARVAARTAEARHVLHFATESRAIERLVAVGSAFVYRLTPGNANHLTEESPLDLDPQVPPELRTWIDCDMLFRAALCGGASGVFNVAGHEAVPLSVLGRWTRRPCIPLPGPLLRAASAAAAQLGNERLQTALAGPHLRYGMSLDTRRAARALGFAPRYRIGVVRAGDGVQRLEAVAT